MTDSKSPKKKTSTAHKKNTSKTSKKNTAAEKKGIKSEKKKNGFKKFYIPVKVINTPKVEERRRLHSVPETVESQKQTNSEGGEASSKPRVSSIKKKKAPKSKKQEKVSSDQIPADTSGEESLSPKKGSGEPDQEKGSRGGKTFSFNMYRKLAVTFIVLTMLLLGGVFYFSFPGLEITVTPQKEKMEDSLMVDIHDGQKASASSESSIAGTLEEVTISEKETFQSTGAETTGKEIKGEVRIINNHSQDQPLVETTRLLSPQDKLYRLEEEVVVPSGGSKKVEIYTEEPSPEMAIDPTEFTIPGLWAGLQDDVYAKSEKAFEYRVKVQRYVQQSDIDKAREKIRKSLKQKVKDKFGDSYKKDQETVFHLETDSIETSVNVEAGEEKEEFTVQIKGDVRVVTFGREKMANLASKKLTALISEGQELVSFDKKNINYTLENFDLNKGVATVESSFQGGVLPVTESKIIKKEKIVDLNKDQLKSYLDEIKEIKDYQLSFSPSFIQQVPNLTDRIKVNIRTQ